MLSSALNPETLLEGLNEVFFDTFGSKLPPAYASLEDIFKTESSKKAQEFDLEMKGVGEFPERGELEDINEDFISEKYKTTYTHAEFANGVPVSKRYLDDNLYGIVKNAVTQLAIAAKHTQYKNAFSVLNNGFSSSFVGADGQPLFDTDHPRDYGTDLSNKLTSKLNGEDILDEAIQMLTEQNAHSGILIPNIPKILLVAPKNFSRAVKLTEAELEPFTNNNAPNVFSSKYNIMVKQSPYLATSQGGNDDAWFLLSEMLYLKRFVREGVSTRYTPWEQSRKNVGYYDASYRESTGWSSPIGIIGSDGTTGTY